jgi:cytochrome P450
MAAGNRDPERFPDPDRLDLRRRDNRHLAFGWASHFCFGAPVARLEGQLTFAAIVRQTSHLALAPGPLAWRENLGLRGLTALPLTFAKVTAPTAGPTVTATAASATGCPFQPA